MDETLRRHCTVQVVWVRIQGLCPLPEVGCQWRGVHRALPGEQEPGPRPGEVAGGR